MPGLPKELVMEEFHVPITCPNGVIRDGVFTWFREGETLHMDVIAPLEVSVALKAITEALGVTLGGGSLQLWPPITSTGIAKARVMIKEWQNIEKMQPVTVAPSLPSCTCDIHLLMRSGCLCGGFLREKRGI